MVRGIRGAITVEANTETAILGAARELLLHVVEANDLDPDQISGGIFTVTPDLTAAFPARAARDLGWHQLAMLDVQQMQQPDDLARCIRLLLLAATDRPAADIRHTYLRDAKRLRPDRQ